MTDARAFFLAEITKGLYLDDGDKNISDYEVFHTVDRLMDVLRKMGDHVVIDFTYQFPKLRTVETVGWGGARVEDLEWCDYDDTDDTEPDEEGPTPYSDWVNEKLSRGMRVAIESEGTHAYDPEEWYLRHEDGDRDLVDPWPAYRIVDLKKES